MSVPDEHANKGPLVLGVSICMTVLAITAVTLRFISRRLSRADFWWDDWFILAALVRSFSPFSMACSPLTGGL